MKKKIQFQSEITSKHPFYYNTYYFKKKTSTILSTMAKSNTETFEGVDSVDDWVVHFR